MALHFERLALIRCAAVLPYNGLMNRAACGTLPNHRCFALVRESDCRKITRAQIRFCERFARHVENARPYVLHIMLDPTRFREILGKFFLRAGNRKKIRRENDGARGGGALI